MPICIRGRLLALFASSQSFGAQLGAGKPRPLGFLVNPAAFGIWKKNWESTSHDGLNHGMLLRCTLAAARWGLMGVVIGRPWCHKRLGLPTRMFYVWNMQYGSKFIPNNGRNVGKYDIRSIEVNSKPFFLDQYIILTWPTRMWPTKTQGILHAKRWIWPIDSTVAVVRQSALFDQPSSGNDPWTQRTMGKGSLKWWAMVWATIIATYRSERPNFTIKTKKG